MSHPMLPDAAANEGSLTIAIESPLEPEIMALIAELNAELLALMPPEHCYHMTPDEMAAPGTHVLVARLEGRAIGCGALRRIGGDIGEVKRMYTRPAHRGCGLGERILLAIIALAREERMRLLKLETSPGSAAACRLYERIGFRACAPYLDYVPSPFSAYYEKAL